MHAHALRETGNCLEGEDERCTYRLDVCMRKVVLSLLFDGVIAGLATALSGALVLPTLAGDKLRDSLADALQGLGHSISGWGPCKPVISC